MFLATWVCIGSLAAPGNSAQAQTIINCTEEPLRAATDLGGLVKFACNGTVTLNSTGGRGGGGCIGGGTGGNGGPGGSSYGGGLYKAGVARLVNTTLSENLSTGGPEGAGGSGGTMFST